MKGRVTVSSKGIIALSYEWDKLVEIPRKAGYYAEAFSVADAMFDDMIFGLFAQRYNTPENSALLSVLTKDRLLSSETMLRILERVKVVDAQIQQLFGEFAWARNKVLHEAFGEYQLAHEKYNKDKKQFSTQEELDSVAIAEADKDLNKGKELFDIIRQKIVEGAGKLQP